MKASYEYRRLPKHGLSYVTFLRKEKQFAFNWHYHPEFELTYIVAGHGMRLVGDHVANYREGDLVLLGSNLPHTWTSEGASGRDQEALVIQFPQDYFQPLLERPEWKHIRRLLTESALGLQFHGKMLAPVASQIRALLKTQGLQGFVGLSNILEILARSRNYRTLTSPAFSPGLKLHQKARLERILRHIESRWREPLPLDEVARLSHMSPSSFSRFFRRMTKKTYITYLNELRVGHACKLLSEGEKGIAEIAFACGFNNLSNFNRRFRTIMRLQPKRYRGRYQGG